MPVSLFNVFSIWLSVNHWVRCRIWPYKSLPQWTKCWVHGLPRSKPTGKNMVFSHGKIRLSSLHSWTSPHWTCPWRWAPYPRCRPASRCEPRWLPRRRWRMVDGWCGKPHPQQWVNHTVPYLMSSHLYVDRVADSYRRPLKSGISWAHTHTKWMFPKDIASSKSTRLCILWELEPS